MKLTPALRNMLKRIADSSDRIGSLMELSIVGSGGRTRSQLEQLINAGYVERCEHELPRGSVPGVRATAAGQAALGEAAKGVNGMPASGGQAASPAAGRSTTPDRAMLDNLAAAWGRLDAAAQRLPGTPAAELTAAVQDLEQAREEMRKALAPVLALRPSGRASDNNG